MAGHRDKRALEPSGRRADCTDYGPYHSVPVVRGHSPCLSSPATFGWSSLDPLAGQPDVRRLAPPPPPSPPSPSLPSPPLSSPQPQLQCTANTAFSTAVTTITTTTITAAAAASAVAASAVVRRRWHCRHRHATSIVTLAAAAIAAITTAAIAIHHRRPTTDRSCCVSTTLRAVPPNHLMLTLNLALTYLIAFARRLVHGGDSRSCWGGAMMARERSPGRFCGAPVCADATRRDAQKSSGVCMMFSRVRHEYGSIGDASRTL